MFTGIVEVVGTITGIDSHEESTTLEIEAPTIARSLGVGDSLSVNGGCLTVARLDGDRLRCDAVRETLDRTALGDLGVGARVNLERALRADGRLDGHFVLGHVDGTGGVRLLERRGDDVRLFVDCGSDFADLLVEKGSVAIDGVALTVVGLGESGFDVALIPHTLTETTLGERRPGDRMNLEADVLGKYVQRYLQRILPETAPRGAS